MSHPSADMQVESVRKTLKAYENEQITWTEMVLQVISILMEGYVRHRV